MDPRKFLKRLATELGLMKNNSNTQKKAERVSEPANFEHRVHVALDEDSGRFVGLPPQWKQVVGRKSDDVSSSEVSHAVSRRSITRRNPVMLDDNALDHTFSRTRNTENFTSFAASLETPRTRASVADNQDLIIERLKRELRDYKARNPHGFEELREDGLLSDGRSYTTKTLNRRSQTQFLPLNKTNSNDEFPRIFRNSNRFHEMAEEDFLSNKDNSKNYGDSELSSKSLHSPTGNNNGFSWKKRNGIKSENHQTVLRRSESDV